MRISDWSSDVCSSDLGQHRNGEGGDQEPAAEQCGAGDEADDEGEREIVTPEQREVELASAVGEQLARDERQQAGRADRRQPQDPGFLEPVPPAALAEYVRSEEHTSELQSLMRISYAVFCLKKK